MGRIDVEFTVANYTDVVLRDQGLRADDAVRRTRVHGIVDTGAARLVLPQRVADELHLKPTGTTTVRYADNRTAQRTIVGDVWLELAGRASVFSAVVEPDRETALIGAIVLEELDLVADCATQSVHPRDPHGMITEIE